MYATVKVKPMSKKFDYPAQLTENGRNQAKIAGEKIKTDGVIIDRIICSPMQRAKDTATIIADVIGFDKDKIVYNPKLVEYNMGELSRKPMEGVTTQQRVTAKGAEDPYKFQERVMSTLREIRYLSGNSLVVCHAGISRIFEVTKKGLDPMNFYDIESYPNAQVIKLDWND
jgi:probable phosphoglycerate mutase